MHARCADRQARRTFRRGQLVEQRPPRRLRIDLRLAQETQAEQRIVQLVGVARVGPHFLAHLADRIGVELAEVGRSLGVHPAPRHHRLRATLFQRCVVEVRIRPRGEDFQRERRRLDEIAREHLDIAAFDRGKQLLEPVDIHRVVQAIADRLLHERVVRDFAVADEVLAARHLVGKDRREQIFGRHALQLRRDLAPAAHAQERERDRAVPAPARAEHRRVEQCLHEQRPHRLRVQVTRHVFEREAVRRRQRQHDRVFGGRGLQLEIELAAEAFAQREPPRAVDAAAERRVHDELHAARFVEETLEHDSAQRRQPAERCLRRREVIDDLLGRRKVERERLRQPCQRCVAPAGIDRVGDRLAQPRHRRRQLVRAPRRFAEPERHARRHAFRVLDAHRAALDAQDPVRGVAELEHVAGQAFDRPVLVHRADDLRLRFEHHRVIGVVGNRAAGRHGRERRAALPAQHAVHRIAMQMRRAPPAPCVEAVGQHARDVDVLVARQLAKRRRTLEQREQLVLAPFLHRHLGGDLLRQHVERLARHADAVELAARDAVEQRGAVAQLVARQRKEPALRRAAHRMARAADALQERGDRAGAAELAHQIDIADVDAELERCGRDERTQLAALQALLGVEPVLARQAAVVRGDVLFADALGQVARGALGEPPRVDEDQRRAVLAHQRREAVVDLQPDLARHHCFQRRRRQLDREVALSHVAGVDDRAIGPAGGIAALADEETRDLVDRFLRRRQADARELTSRQRLQPFQRQRQMRAAFVRRQLHGSRRRSRCAWSRASCGPPCS